MRYHGTTVINCSTKSMCIYFSLIAGRQSTRITTIQKKKKKEMFPRTSKKKPLVTNYTRKRSLKLSLEESDAEIKARDTLRTRSCATLPMSLCRRVLQVFFDEVDISKVYYIDLVDQSETLMHVSEDLLNKFSNKQELVGSGKTYTGI